MVWISTQTKRHPTATSFCFRSSTMKSIVFALCVLGLSAASALDSVQPLLPANARHTYNEWMAVFEAQRIAPEECDGCKAGTKPQNELAGRVAVPAEPAEPAEPGQDSRIIGGEVAKLGQFPWQAQVRMDGSYFCGGSIIDDEWILTAGHCGSGFSSFVIVLGSFYSQKSDEPNRMTISSRKAYVHDQYDSFHISNDISLIQLPNKINWTTYIRPVRLPSQSQASMSFAGADAVLSGWGRYGSSSVSSSISPELRFVNLTVLGNEDCAKYFGASVRATNVCTSGSGTKGACNGDSGGALTVYANDSTVFQVGIVSYGTSLGCNKQYPSVYTRVASYLKWISDKTGIATD